MADYMVDSTELTAIANAIRAKSGKTEQLIFPGGFMSEIDALQTGQTGLEKYITETYDETTGNAVTAKLHGYTNVPSRMFTHQVGLTSVSLPNGITSIDSYAFQSCSKLDFTSLPSGLTIIDDFAFYGCTNLSIASLPSGITTIGTYTFNSCTGLTSLTFEGTPTSIGNYAFGGCNNLTDIKAPWARGAVAGAPWGATKATITYNYTGEGE